MDVSVLSRGTARASNGLFALNGKQSLMIVSLRLTSRAALYSNWQRLPVISARNASPLKRMPRVRHKWKSLRFIVRIEDAGAGRPPDRNCSLMQRLASIEALAAPATNSPNRPVNEHNVINTANLTG